MRILLSAFIRVAANAVGLFVAALLLGRMSISALSFLFAVLIFSVAEAFIEPLIRQIAVQNKPSLTRGVALITTFLGLLVTDLISDGLDIEGIGTWIMATVIVWGAASLAHAIFPRLFPRDTDGDAAAGTPG